MLSKQILLRYKTPMLVLLSITLIVMGAILSGAFSAKKVVTEQPPIVRSLTVKMSSAEQSAKYAGEVRGRYESQLAFQVSGKIIRRNIELGSQVAAGSVLMEIDPKDVQQTVNISAAQV